MDHAGISTQLLLKRNFIRKKRKPNMTLGREKFLEMVWNWKEEYGGTIMDQLKKLGVSCDWDYFTFTMDETPNRAVRKVFADLFNKGLIYQADYIVNWDPILQSAISDAEVEYKEVKGAFYHIHYKVKDSDELLEVATTRPETLLGDTAVAVNPNDDRFKHLIGKTAIVPICNREVTIVGDDYVDMEKGTGCLKVTPGHDFNDFEIGKRHNLEIIKILNTDGTLNDEYGLEWAGQSAMKARKSFVEKLKEEGILVKVEEHMHQVGHGQRSDEIVEPMVSKQWFLNTKEMAARSVKAVESGEMTFYPKNWENTYFAYQKNPRDWCISRQLWWGHQIPIYYCEHGHTFASETDPSECPECGTKSFKQDPDVLDTWFSSGLFPLSTLGWPLEDKMKEKKFETFYPTSTLVTGFDIIFFWVARMMMMCDQVTGKAPFAHAYIHGIVRDKQGRKMSKSLGNGIDPIELINQYGTDAMRFTLAAGSGYSRGLNLDPERIEGYRNFINKVWNAFRFIQPHLEHADANLPDLKKLSIHDKWILSELNTVTKSVNESIEEYRYDDASATIYSFVYDKFCSWYIELSKNILNGDNENAKNIRSSVLKYGFKKIVALLHPLVPFITEELWSHLKEDNEPLICNHEYPEFNKDLVFTHEQESMNKFTELITTIRNLRASVNIKPKDEISAHFYTDDKDLAEFLYSNRVFMKDLAKVSKGEIKAKKDDRPKKSIFGATSFAEVYIPLEGVIDLDEQVKRIKKDIEKTEKEFMKFDKKLSNEKFINNAKPEAIEDAKTKANLYKEKLDSLQNSLELFQ
jgi:valyl-tRNA synthetase